MLEEQVKSISFITRVKSVPITLTFLYRFEAGNSIFAMFQAFEFTLNSFIR